MPGSRRRKRQMAANRRQLGRARRKIQREGRGKENRGSLLQNCGSNSSLENRPALTSGDEAAGTRGWWDSLYNWCHASLAQRVDTVKDVVFPSRVLRRQLDDAEQRLREMEEELNLIRNREIRERKRKRKMRSSTGTMRSTEPLQSDITASVAPPPPPPPPPSLASEPRITRTKAKRAQNKGTQKLQPSVTLDDIRSVKLRSVEDRQCSSCSSSSSSGFVVSLADLKGVTLRNTAILRRRSLSSHETSSQDFSNVRSSLRRVGTVRRSPSGTLHYSKNRSVVDSGEGPTPMLARALRRKFKVALPLSPINSVTPSPVVSPVFPALPSPPPPSTQTTAPPSPPPNSTQTTATNSPASVLEIREI